MSTFLKNLDLSKINNGRKTQTTKMHGPPFPQKLYRMLEDVCDRGLENIVSWLPDGRAFAIHKSETFAEVVLPLHFDQRYLRSFQRQLKLYGFTQVTSGQYEVAYEHPLFIRGQEHLCRKVKRNRHIEPVKSHEQMKVKSLSDDDRITLEILNELEFPSDPSSRQRHFFNFYDDTQLIGENFHDGTRVSFFGHSFFFLPVEFTDLHQYMKRRPELREEPRPESKEEPKNDENEYHLTEVIEV